MDVTVDDARNRLDQLLDLAASGVEVVVTRNGKPPVQFVPGDARPSRPPLQGQELRAAIDRILSTVDPLNVSADLRTSNHDDLYDEFGAPK